MLIFQDNLNSISGGKKRRKSAAIILKNNTKSRDDLVGFDSSSDSDVDDDNSEVREAEKIEEIVEDIKVESIPSVSTIEVVPIPPASNAVVERDIKSTISNDQSANQPRRKAVWVPVERKPDIQEARLKLPILAEEQAIMEVRLIDI